MSIRLRNESSSDSVGIEALIEAAFRDAPHTSHTEHLIFKELRDAGALTVSLVAEDDGVIIGHVAVSPVTISDGTSGWYGLGPVAVAPERQGEGIGTELIRAALAELRRLDAAGCVVLGEPGFYGRFGFRAEPALVLADVPPEYFQAIVFRAEIPSGSVTYHQAFNAQS